MLVETDAAVHLHTPRLLLREFTLDDVPTVLAYQRDARYLQFHPAREITELDAFAFVQQCIDWRQEEPRSKYQLAIELASTGELIGNVGLRLPYAYAPLAEVGFELAPGHWRQGYATEAAKAMLTYGFHGLGLHRVHSHCIAENAASARVLERLGMQQEGRLREHQFFKDRWWDVLIYGMLETEWQG